MLGKGRRLRHLQLRDGVGEKLSLRYPSRRNGKMLEDSIEYARVRQQFGKPIGKYQAISHKIADMKVRNDLSRLILYKVSFHESGGKAGPMESAIAKLFISESYVQNCQDAIQIHGAYGYSTEYDLNAICETRSQENLFWHVRDPTKYHCNLPWVMSAGR
jgi:alkylation response protein AidB-like acyl-CoA dehydrogenase